VFVLLERVVYGDVPVLRLLWYGCGRAAAVLMTGRIAAPRACGVAQCLGRFIFSLNVCWVPTVLIRAVVLLSFPQSCGHAGPVPGITGVAGLHAPAGGMPAAWQV
jgi:hypothetical protein